MGRPLNVALGELLDFLRIEEASRQDFMRQGAEVHPVKRVELRLLGQDVVDHHAVARPMAPLIDTTLRTGQGADVLAGRGNGRTALLDVSVARRERVLRHGLHDCEDLVGGQSRGDRALLDLVDLALKRAATGLLEVLLTDRAADGRHDVRVRVVEREGERAVEIALPAVSPAGRGGGVFGGRGRNARGTEFTDFAGARAHVRAAFRRLAPNFVRGTTGALLASEGMVVL